MAIDRTSKSVIAKFADKTKVSESQPSLEEPAARPYAIIQFLRSICRFHKKSTGLTSGFEAISSIGHTSDMEQSIKCPEKVIHRQLVRGSE